MESDFVKSWAILMNLVSNSAAELFPISSFPLNSEELLYINKGLFKYLYFEKDKGVTCKLKNFNLKCSKFS